MKRFLNKTCSLLLIILILVGYNVVLMTREKDEEISYLTAKVWALEKYVKETQETGEAVSESKYQDGIWEGEAEGFGGMIRVQVTIEEDSITDVEILSAKQEDPAYLSMEETVLTSIQKEQSTQVDTVSGATFSSEGIINAVSQALEKAEK